MVFGLSLAFLLAHGADPTPLEWDEALANLVKFAVTFLLIGFLSYPILAPLLADSNETPDKESSNSDAPQKNEIVGWIGAGLLVVLAMGWWLARTSLVEVMTEEQKVKEDHAHTQMEGGQIAMWSDFHAEVVRVESGELRIYLRDSYNRDIAARFFDAKVQPLKSDPKPTPEPTRTPVPRVTATPLSGLETTPEPDFIETNAALNESYRFCRLPREVSLYKIKVSTPGWTASLKFDFDGSKGKRSLPIWCATP